MNHIMKLTCGPFEKIVSGQKIIESRLYDEKRRQIALEDEITFRLVEDHDGGESRTVTKVVKALHIYPDFESLMKSLPAGWFGWGDAKQAIDEINAFYGQEDQKKWGVVGIELRNS